MKAISATEFLALDGLKREYLIPGLVPEVSRIALYGVAKRGKSFLALQLALSVCQGIPFLGFEVVKTGPVLYLQFDTPPELWQDRLLRLSKAGIAIPDNLYVVHPSTQPRRVNILDGHHISQLHDLVTATLPALVIVDVLRSVHYLSENESEHMQQVVGRLTTLFAGRALLIVHHTAKPNLAPGATKPSPSMAGRGSSYLGGEVDANWLLESRQRSRATFEVEARFAAPADEIILVQNKHGLWTRSVQTSTVGRPPEALDAALAFLHDHPELDTYSKGLKAAVEAQISPATFGRAWREVRPQTLEHS